MSSQKDSHALTLIGIHDHDQRYQYTVSVELDGEEILRSALILGTNKFHSRADCWLVGKHTSFVLFKLYKVLDDTTSVEGEARYSLVELISARGIEHPKGFSIALPPSSVFISVQLLSSNNEERNSSEANLPQPMDWQSSSSQAYSLMNSYKQTRQLQDLEDAIRILLDWYDSSLPDSNDRDACANSLGNAFHMRLQHLNSIDDLEKVIYYWSVALESWTPGSPFHVPLVVNLGGMFRRRFEWRGNFEDIEQAIDMYAVALSGCLPDNPYRHNLLNNYATAVLCRFEQTGDSKDLEFSIQTHQECLSLRLPGHPSRPGTLSNLADAHSIRYRQKANVDDFNIAMAYYREALELVPAESPSHAIGLMNIGLALSGSFERSGDLQNLHEAIEHYAAALIAFPENHQTRPALLANYAGALHLRFAQTGDINDLDHSIEHFTDSLAKQSLTHSNRFSSLIGLGDALLSRYNNKGALEDLDLAFTHVSSSMALCRPSRPEYICVLMSLIKCFIMRYKERGDVSDLDIACEHTEEAINVCPRDSIEYFGLLTHVNNALSTRFSRRKDVSDLKRIIDYCNSVLSNNQEHRIATQVLAVDRADALLELYFHEGAVGDLEQAISSYQGIMQYSHRGHRVFSHVIIQFASALQARFEKSGKEDDLNRAISYCRSAGEDCPPGHINHFAAFAGLGNALLLRHQIFGPMDALDESIIHLTHVLEARTSNNPDHPKSLMNLAYALFVRYQTQHGDLDVPMGYLQAALDHPNQAERRHILCLLAAVHSALYDDRGGVSDLQESINLFEYALPMFSPQNPQKLHLLRNLGDALRKMFLKQRKLDDLYAAISHFETNLATSQEDDPDLPLTLIWLANCIHMRAFAHRDDNDLQKSLSLLTVVSDKLPGGHTQFFLVYSLYASVYTDCYKLSRDNSYLEKAFRYHELASSASGIHPWDHLVAALIWRTNADEYHHSSALEAYKTSMKLLDRHIMTTPTVSGRYTALFAGISRNTPSLAADATACAIGVGDLELAVELSEQGRGLLWSQMSRFRAAINDLRVVDDEGRRLADEFDVLSAQLRKRHSDSSAISSAVSILRRTQAEQESRQYRQDSLKWDAVVIKIRQKQGFSHFLHPMPYKESKTAALDGPVVLVNASVKRCDGIIVTKNGPPRLVPLPHTSLAGITSMSDEFRNVLRNTAGAGEEKMREKQLIPVLRRLWEVVLAPIVEALLTIVPKGSRVWWCPTSKLTSMPIHAAGPYRKGAINLPNIYVSSYTPTLSALIRSRRHGATQIASKAPSIVLIGQSKPDSGSGERELEAVAAELELAKSLVPPSMPHSEVSGDEGTFGGVIHALQTHPWVHLACHGKQDLAQPFDSSFALRDKPLRLLDIIQAELENPEFAFLSACHTAVGDKNTPDEVIHLAAGLQFSGFKSVIGTMWAVDDTTAHHMVKEFYTTMFSGSISCTNAARALNKASKTVNKDEVPMDQRVVFIHIGA